VVLFTTSPNKAADAKRLGANEVVNSRNSEEMQKHAGSFDFILTRFPRITSERVPAVAEAGCTMTLVGAPEKPAAVAAFNFLMKRRRLAGSAIAASGNAGDAGFLREARNHFGHRVDSNSEGQRCVRAAAKSDVKYRFVIDMASLK